MTTLERVRAEIEKHTDGKNHCDEYLDGYNDGMKDALEIIEKYAEQEPTKRQSCENCKHDRKACGNDDHYGFCQNWEYAEQEPTSRVKNELKVELNELEPCDDAVSRQAVIQIFDRWLANGDYNYSERNIMNCAISEIKDLPHVQPVACIAKVEFDEDKLEKIVNEAVVELKSETVTEFADRCRECGTRYIRKSVLADIRAEIEQERVHDDWDYGQEIYYNNAIDDVLQIIDKYKAEMRIRDES